jgi:hypothetical protein|tara:strand:- start:300 stop:473 length:174 start_codon:yes stop_codon:yes gene_type:complete
MPNNIGSVGKYMPTPPMLSCSRLSDRGVQKTTNRKSLSNAKMAANAINKTIGNKFKK